MSAIRKQSSFARSVGDFNVTMQYGTLDYILEEMFDIGGMLDRMQIRMVATLLSTVSIGIYTACAAYAARILIRRDRGGNRKKLLCVTVAMYAATFVYWVAFVVAEFQTLRAVMRRLSGEISWLHNLGVSLVPPSECFSWVAAGRLAHSDCIGTATLTFNVVIGDAIVWWRVWVLWNKNRPILAACCVVLLATLACGMADSISSCSSGQVVWNTGAGNTVSNFTEAGAFFGGNVFGLVAIILSLFSNSLATLLVGYKAWRHRVRAKEHFAGVPGVTRVQRVLMLLVESGVAYCVLWTFVLSSNLSTVLPLHPSVEWTTGLQGWTIDMLYFTEGCLVAFVGIYPTLIIILVALDKSEIEKQSQAYSIPVARGLRSSLVQVDPSTDVRMRTQSVIMIGPHASPNGPSTQLSEVDSEEISERVKSEC